MSPNIIKKIHVRLQMHFSKIIIIKVDSRAQHIKLVKTPTTQKQNIRYLLLLWRLLPILLHLKNKPLLNQITSL